jgi:hypothetical protein
MQIANCDRHYDRPSNLLESLTAHQRAQFRADGTGTFGNHEGLEKEEGVMARKLAIAVSLVLMSSAAWADDLQLGIWKVNVARSSFKTAPPPKSQTVTIVRGGKDGIKLTVNAINAKGEKSTIEYAAQYDGKEYPRTETGAGAVAGQTVTLRRVDSHIAERVAFLKWKKLTIEKWEISKDGKTRTVTQSGVNAQGQPVDNVLVYEKQ